MTDCITHSHPQALHQYLLECREAHGLPADQLIPSPLADDRTSVTAARIRKSPSKGRSGTAFTLFMLPLEHMLPNLFFQTIARWSGRIDLDRHRLQETL
jgi:hypothetical protein